MRSIALATVLLAAGLMTGCAATVSADAYPPDMVYVSPGVQVVADYDEPIFYSDGFYWRFYGGGWYRSTYYTGGWVYARPPVAVMRIDRPYAYAHYRPTGYVARHPAGGWRGGGPAPAPRGGGWRGSPTTAPPPAAASNWRSGPGPAPAGRPGVAGGWRGNAAPAPAARPAPAPQMHPGPAARPAPRGHGGGWRGH